MAKYVLGLLGERYPVGIIPKSVEVDHDVVFEELPIPIRNRLNRCSARPEVNWLYVATPTPHKNHLILIRAFEMLRGRKEAHRLVLTIDEATAVQLGGESARQLIDAGLLVALGWINKSHLRSLYSNCDGCVMPSVLESLSSSHLEAMEWKVPQIVADLPYARDLCGEAAVYVNPYDAEQWVGAILSLSEDQALKKRLIEEGSKRMKQFPASWTECAERTRLFLSSII